MKATNVITNIRARGRSSTYTAWFDGHPFGENANLLGAERVDSLGRVYSVTPEQWASIERGPWCGDIKVVSM
jgi:hypothetical protein